MLATTSLLRKRSRKEGLFLLKEKKMVSISLNVGNVMNLVIMHLNFLRERKSIKESLILEEIEIEIVYMQMRMKNMMKKVRVKVMMN